MAHGGGDQAGFYAGAPVFDGFDRIMDPAVYVPLPDDWVLGLTDVVRSTEAIGAGRYRAVNTAGAAAIAAVSNALGHLAFPFAFGGDGASFAVPPDKEAIVRRALAATVAWVRDELDLELRAAVVPVAAARAAGFDVRVGRFAVSPSVTYAMFSGGGLSWAERQLKEGRFRVEPGAAGERPDLGGLSCRFAEMPAERGIVVSLIVTPAAGADEASFRTLVEEILTSCDAGDGAARPIPVGGPVVRWPPPSFELEVRARRPKGGSLLVQRLKTALVTLVAYVIFRFRLVVGKFDPKRYVGELVENSDFRKFDDGLRMTIDCPAALADRLEARLKRAEAEGVARYGLHRQAAAVLTCFVPSPLAADHVHFVDGAAGGYAAAAAALKAS